MLTLEERFSAALHCTARSWRQALDRRLKDLGVGQSGWQAIAAVAKSAAPLSQTELAHQLNVEDPSVVSLIDRLVKSGFVTRVPSEADRRVKHVVLTDAGTQLYAKVKTAANAFRAELLGDVDKAILHAATELLEHLQHKADASQ